MARLYVIVLLPIVCCAARAEQTGTVAGRVVDAKGKAVILANVVLADEADSNVHYDVTTNKSGDFRLPAVAPGTFTLAIKAKGFIDDFVLDIRVAADESSDLKPIVLRIDKGCTRRHCAKLFEDMFIGTPIHYGDLAYVSFNGGIDADVRQTNRETPVRMWTSAYNLAITPGKATSSSI